MVHLNHLKELTVIVIGCKVVLTFRLDILAKFHSLFTFPFSSRSTTPFPSRDYIKEQCYTQAAQYANKGKGDNQIIVFSTPFRMSASGYQPEVNETTMITASSPVVVKKGANSVVAAGELWRTTRLLLCSLMDSYSVDKVLWEKSAIYFFMCCQKNVCFVMR